MYFDVLEPIEYCISGEQRRATPGKQVFITVRSVAKELLKQKKIRESNIQGKTLAEIANPAKKVEPAKAVVLQAGSLIRVKNVEEVVTVVDILDKQVKVEFSSGETKRVAKSRIEEVLD